MGNERQDQKSAAADPKAIKSGETKTTAVSLREHLLAGKPTLRQLSRLVKDNGVQLLSGEERAEVLAKGANDPKVLERLIGLVVMFAGSGGGRAVKTSLVPIMSEFLVKAVPDLTVPVDAPRDDIDKAAATITTSVKSKRQQRVLLALLVLTAIYTPEVPIGDTDGIVAKVFEPRSRKRRRSPKRIQGTTPSEDPAVLLPLLTKASTLQTALQVRSAYLQRVLALERQAVEMSRTIDHLRHDLAETRETVSLGNARTAALEKQLATSNQEIQVLRNDLKAQMTTSAHDIQTLRAKAKGFLRSELTRWLQTALDAATADPPRINVIMERIEQALNRVEKEIQWMESSGSTSGPPTASPR